MVESEEKVGQAEKEENVGEEIVNEGKLESGEMVEEDKADEGEEGREDKAEKVSEDEIGEKEGEEVVEERVVDAEEASELKAEEGEDKATTDVKDNADEKDESDKESDSAPIAGDSTEARETLVNREETERKYCENGETAAASTAQSETSREETESTSQDTKGKNDTEVEDRADEKDMEAETKTDELDKVETEENAEDQEEAKKATLENAEKETENLKESEESQVQSEQKTQSKDRIDDDILESEDKDPGTNTENLDEGKEKVDNEKTEVTVVSAEDDDSTERASKPSEEGASIVLKPQSETPQKESIASGKEANVLEERSVTDEEHAVTLDTLEKENRVLVTNWVNVHQSSKFFETFIDPLDYLTSDNTISESNSNVRSIESAHVTELSIPESPTKTIKTPDPKPDDHYTNASERSAAVEGRGDTIVESAVNELKEAGSTTKDENKSNGNNKVEVIQSDLRSTHSREDEPSETGPTKDFLEPKKETEVTVFTLSIEPEHSSGEATAGPEEKGQRSSEELKETTGMSEANKDMKDISKTDVESIRCSNHLASSGRPENISENSAETEETKDKSGLDEQQTTVEEITDNFPKMEMKHRSSLRVQRFTLNLSLLSQHQENQKTLKIRRNRVRKRLQRLQKAGVETTKIYS
ncbi:unnamed protein product [Coregonus sp. 'balchen']|nr:unnamed protein product [Coregonus sp. 'balchen']